MKRYKRLAALALAAVLGIGVGSAAAFVDKGHAMKPKVRIAEARAIALKAVPGKIVGEELEREQGGSGLRYSFDIMRSDVTHEVGVDAKTGKLLEDSVEGPNTD